MNWVNYHSHSTYSDGKEALESYLLAGLEQGIIAFGFSDHAPLPLDCNWPMNQSDLEFYFKEIGRLKKKYEGQIQVYCGLEIDYIPGIIDINKPWVKEAPLDYCIGSIHFVDQFEDGTPWSIDSHQGVFKAGLKQIFQDDIRMLVHRYFQLTREMVSTACPTIIGHVDRIRKNNKSNAFFSEEESWYRNEVLKTLEVIAAHKTILEVNTKAYYRNVQPDPNPGKWVLQEAKAMGIPVHLASDTHHPDDNVKAFAHGINLLLACGYEAVTVLLNGEWLEIPIDQSGMKFPPALVNALA